MSIVPENLVDKAFEGKTAQEILEAPVSALQGVSDKDATLLKEAFGIETVKDLATNKFFINAKSILEMAQ